MSDTISPQVRSETADTTKFAAIDYSQPILAQVGRLGNSYSEWTHKPSTGAPRYFRSKWAEIFTKNPWWVVPLIWVPVDCFLLGASIYMLQWNLVRWLSCIVGGILTWQLVEYSLHRWVFHMEPTSPALIVLHFSLHGAHHKFPLDKMRLVFPPFPATVIAVIIFSAVRGVLGELAPSLATMAGIVAGYIAYDMTHYWCHHGRRLPAVMEGIRRAHMDHHYRDHSVSFGVSSPLYDYVFQTLPCKAVGE